MNRIMQQSEWIYQLSLYKVNEMEQKADINDQEMLDKMERIEITINICNNCIENYIE